MICFAQGRIHVYEGSARCYICKRSWEAVLDIRSKSLTSIPCPPTCEMIWDSFNSQLRRRWIGERNKPGQVLIGIIERYHSEVEQLRTKEQPIH